MARKTITQVTKFLGLNQSADSLRELELGQASEALNFAITDGQNITIRPGISRIAHADGTPAGLWSGYIRDDKYLISAVQHEQEAYTDFTFYKFDGAFREVTTIPLYHRPLRNIVKIFPFGSKVYICIGYDMWSIVFQDGLPYAVPEPPYIPLAVVGAAPGGGGTSLEPLNILCEYARVQYSADGEATEYTLPTNSYAVKEVMIDNEIVRDAGTFNRETHMFTFKEAPVKGVDNVEITYDVSGVILDAREKFANMPYWEAYNGPTDSRLFFYGDGTNITYYTGVTEAGRGSVLYIPAGSEISIDMSDSPITGATRHYNKLLFFKPDCTAAVTYEPMTLVDGSTIAAFTVKTVHKEAGNEAPGQIQLCANTPRSLAKGSLYSWTLPNYAAQDERAAKNISAPVVKSLASADLTNVATVDDSASNTYYIFLNDDEGTVLVNRYALDTWTMYKSTLFRSIAYAAVYQGRVCFMGDRDGVISLYYLDKDSRYDAKLDANAEFDESNPESVPQPIRGKWYTGYMDFKADNLKKFSSMLWVSLLPQRASRVSINASTDKKEKCIEESKEIGSNIFDYSSWNYAYFTYNSNHAPTMKRLKMKVKKFTYYMLKFDVDKPGATATILSYDQQVRYGSEVK